MVILGYLVVVGHLGVKRYPDLGRHTIVLLFFLLLAVILFLSYSVNEECYALTVGPFYEICSVLPFVFIGQLGLASLVDASFTCIFLAAFVF